MARQKKADVSKLKYEEAREALESIIERIEAGDVGLEESLTQFEQGMSLINHCRGILDKAETRMKELQMEHTTSPTAREDSGTIDPHADDDGDYDDTQYPDDVPF